MSTPRDYYEVLGVARDAGKDDIKRRYRALALELHPDRNKALGAAEKFKEVSEAYAVLSDEAKRAAYDRYGHAGVDQRWASPEDLFRGADFEDILGGFGLGGFEDLFAQMFGARPRRRGRDLEVAVNLTLEEVATGTTRTLHVQRRGPCHACKGSGAAPGTGRAACATCRGRGQVRQARGGGAFQFVQVGPCPDCRGEGSRIEDPCTACRGSGGQEERVPVEVEVPAGIAEGSVVRLRGMGEQGPRGAPPGDLFVGVQVEPHPRFERRGLDLVTVLPVPYPVAALGGSVEVEHLGGKVEKVQVLAGTQGGTVLSLEGHGLRDARGRKGDLHLLVQIAVPEKVGGRARELLRELEKELGTEPANGNLREALQGFLGKLGGRREDDDA